MCILKIVIAKRAGGIKVLIHHTFLKTPAPLWDDRSLRVSRSLTESTNIMSLNNRFSKEVKESQTKKQYPACKRTFTYRLDGIKLSINSCNRMPKKTEYLHVGQVDASRLHS